MLLSPPWVSPLQVSFLRARFSFLSRDWTVLISFSGVSNLSDLLDLPAEFRLSTPAEVLREYHLRKFGFCFWEKPSERPPSPRHDTSGASASSPEHSPTPPKVISFLCALLCTSTSRTMSPLQLAPARFFKVSVVGDGRVGKTCLSRALRHQSFRHTPETHGLKLRDIPLPGCVLAGHEVVVFVLFFLRFLIPNRKYALLRSTCASASSTRAARTPTNS